MAAGTLTSLWGKPRNPMLVSKTSDKAAASQDANVLQPIKPPAFQFVKDRADDKARSASQEVAEGPKRSQNDQASGGENRKRRRHSAHQLEKLHALFAKTQHPSAMQQQTLANEVGLEKKQVMCWFDTTRRKRARQDAHSAKQAAMPDPIPDRPSAEIIELDSDNELPACSGPTAETVSRGGTTDAGGAALPRQHAGTERSDVRISAMSQAANPRRMSSPEEVEPDSSSVEQPRGEFSASAHVDARDLAAPANQEDSRDEIVNIDDEDDLMGFAVDLPADQERTAAQADQSNVDAQVLAGNGPTNLEQACGEAEQAAVQSCGQKAAAGNEGGQAPWTPQLVAQKRAELEVEIALAQEHAAKLQALAQIPTEVQQKDKRWSLGKPEVAALLMGSSLPLSKLTAQLTELHSTPEQGGEVTELAVRNCILDLAARKSFAARDGKSDLVDALEDESKTFMWRWELRSLKSLPKHHQQPGKILKQKLTQVTDRMTALDFAIKQLDAFKPGRANPKLYKALDKLSKLPGLVLNSGSSPASKAVASQQAHETALSGAIPSTSQCAVALQAEGPQSPRQGAEADFYKQEKADAKEEARKKKEASKAEKEAEKERLRLEKEAQRAEKDAEKERLRSEKEASKQGKKRKVELTGFGSVKTIEKSRNAFTKFFTKTPAAAAATPGSCPQSGSAIKRLPFHDLLSPELPESLKLQLQTEVCIEKLEDAITKQASPGGLEAGHRDIKSRWKAAPRHKRRKGRPPTWARRLRKGSRQDDSDDEVMEVVTSETWRRKFLYFPADQRGAKTATPNALRPPYYGSWSLHSSHVGPRRYLAKDPVLDYEVMSDQEWEPEPEGESLSDDEADDEELLPEDSQNDGFIIPDGELSEDEGLSSVQQDIDDMCTAEHEDDAASAPQDAVASESAAAASTRRLLEDALRKARPRPLIISRLPGASEQTTNYPGCLCGNASLLAGLEAQVIAPTMRLRLLPEPFQDAESPGAPPRVSRQGPGRPPGSSNGERPLDIVPNLISFLQAHPEIKAVPKAVQAFMEAHPERKLVKKWLTEKIKEVADRSSGGWRIKPEAVAAVGLADPAKPTEAAAEPPEVPKDEDNAAGSSVQATPPQPAQGGRAAGEPKGRMQRFLNKEAHAAGRPLINSAATTSTETINLDEDMEKLQVPDPPQTKVKKTEVPNME